MQVLADGHIRLPDRECHARSLSAKKQGRNDARPRLGPWSGTPVLIARSRPSLGPAKPPAFDRATAFDPAVPEVRSRRAKKLASSGT